MAEVVPISIQQNFWNRWNAETREHEIQDVSIRQAQVVMGWFSVLDRKDMDILEVGCGSGWLCPQLARFGRVTGTDLSDEVLTRAQQRTKEITYVSGDFMDLDFGDGSFDVIVTLEVLSHVANQEAFIAKLAKHLRPGGHLMMATQNRFVLQRFNRISPPAPGQLRQWVDRGELQALLEKKFEISSIFTVTPKANRGFMRIMNSRKLNVPIRALVGERLETFKEKAGLGWTIMALAHKPLNLAK